MNDPFQSLETFLRRQPYASRWQPAADVYRMPDGWLLKIELAGVRPDELEVRTAGHQLVLRGRRRDMQLHESGQCQSLEIVYDEFERRFDFPIELTSAGIESEYAHGMLTLRIRHPEESP